MGGASGGFTASRIEIVDMLRQRSRPYLFSNTLAPSIVGGSIAAFDLLEKSGDLRKKLADNTKYFREAMNGFGFDIIEGIHPIVPVLFRKFDDDSRLAQNMARDLYAEGIYVVGFSYPVVPKGQARIRVQISAVHTREDLDLCIKAFEKVGKKLHVIK
jgi:glycine C-acetyltransferase